MKVKILGLFSLLLVIVNTVVAQDRVNGNPASVK